MGYVGSAELDLHLVASIINTASPTSTSFIEVFKAYNDVLQACGLDPADDVVYYRFILKLGSVPGANWGERWARWLAESPDFPSTSTSPPPQASPPLPPPQPLPKRISESRAAIEEELRREDEERARQKEDERRADIFYEVGLTGRCWDVWRKGREWVTTTAAQIDRARAFLLLGSTLAHWRKVHQKHRSLNLLASQLAQRSLLSESVETWVGAHRARRDMLARVDEGARRVTVGKTWLRWRTRWEGRRMTRWQESLAEREALLTDKLDRRRTTDALAHWREARLVRLADEHRSQRLLSSTFARWRTLQDLESRLTSRLEIWEAESRGDLLRSAFEAWAQKTKRRAAEETVSATVCQRTLATFFTRWKTDTDHSVSSKNFRRTSLLKLGLRTVRTHLSHITALDDLVLQHAQRKAQATLQTSFAKWQVRLEAQDVLSDVADRHCDRRFVQSHLKRWTSRRTVVAAAHQRAVAQDEQKLKGRTLARWIAGCVKHGEQLSLMQSFKDVHLEVQVKRSFVHWLHLTRQSLQKKAEEQAAQERERLDVLRTSWQAWVDKLKEARLRSLEDHVASVRARNTLDSALFVWESRATVAVAIHFDKVRLKRAALRTLREVLPRARERNRAKAIERRRLLANAFALWSSKTQTKLASRPPPRLRGISRTRPRLSGSGFADSAARRAR